MFKPHYGVCKNPECQREDALIVVKDGFCDFCNHKRKAAAKKLKGKKNGYTYKRKPTGEKDVFEEVLDLLPDDKPTTCYACGKRISVVTHSNFAHILSKGRFPRFRLYPENIKIMCFNIDGTGCHSRYDHQPKSTLTEDYWERVFELREKLIEEYNHLDD